MAGPVQQRLAGPGAATVVHAAGRAAFVEAHHTTGDTLAAHHAWQQALSILDDLQHPDAAAVRTKLDPQAE